jgi:GT2 family glycosyltransferase
LATADVVTFPNDNCWYPPEAINAAIAYLEANPGIAGLSAKLVTPAGRRAVIRWGRRPTGISRSNFYRTSTGSALFLRREIFDKTGYFDESMGTGSPGRIGAGEDADLILRVVAAGHRLSYCPEILIFVDQGHGIVRDDGKVSPENVTKLAKYGVAMGYLWRRHRLPSVRLLYICARKSVKSALLAVRGHRILAQAELAYIRGAIVGWRGVEQ